MAWPAVLRRKTRSALPDPDVLPYMGLSTTYGSDGTASERVHQLFDSYASQGYASNSVVFSLILKRQQFLSQAEFKFQNRATRRLYYTDALRILEQPWPNGTTADLMARMELHGSLGGNAFVRRSEDQLVLMRPDWVDIVSVLIDEGPDEFGVSRLRREVIGYLYSEGGFGLAEPAFYDVSEVAHWSPIPDPLSPNRGMSWLTPVLREINADLSMTKHRQVFFDNAATPNIMLKYQGKLTDEQLRRLKARWQSRYAGPKGAGATMVLDEGVDFQAVGHTFEQMRFTDIQAAGEARIAAASGVPPIIASLQAGLDASTFANYGQAFKAFAYLTGASLWQSMCSALSKLVEVPSDSRLWYDTTNVPALREDEKDRAVAIQGLASAAGSFITQGWDPDSIIATLTSSDLTQLKHTGMVSVQLYPPGQGPSAAPDPAAPAAD